jgi:hypothetical protein
MRTRSAYERGDVVEVKSLDEILSTLDADGKLEGMPFMSEMARHCGRRFRIVRRADKTCVEGFPLRRLERTVFLEGLRCDGSAHDGCQRSCLLFWKEAWLRPCDANVRPAGDGAGAETAAGNYPCRSVEDLPTRKGDRFLCQSTELAAATIGDFPRWNLRYYVHDLLRGEITLPWLGRILWRSVKNKVRRCLGLKLIERVEGCQPKPPRGDLDLQPGEWVEVKSAEEIRTLIDAEGKNHGLSFELEMLQHCGLRYQVAYPLRKVIVEEPGRQSTGKIVALTNTVVLDGVDCRGLCMKNCPRANFFWWREAWLRRVTPPKATVR